ncbi:unnamed protein product [Caenorhabditis nigoni]
MDDSLERLTRQFMDETGLSEEHVRRLNTMAVHLAQIPEFMRLLDDVDSWRDIDGLPVTRPAEQPVDPVFDEDENQENEDPNWEQELELPGDDGIMEEFFRVQEEQIAQEEEQNAEENNNLPEDD